MKVKNKVILWIIRIIGIYIFVLSAILFAVGIDWKILALMAVMAIGIFLTVFFRYQKPKS